MPDWQQDNGWEMGVGDSQTLSGVLHREWGRALWWEHNCSCCLPPSTTATSCGRAAEVDSEWSLGVARG